MLAGSAADSLLDSYETERKGHVQALTTRIKAIGQLVGERDVARARERDAQLLAACGGVVQSQPRQSVQPALADGLLSPHRHPAVGTIFPQPWIVSDGRRQRMDDVAGRGWRVVKLNTCTEADGVLAAWFSSQQCVAAIVRPDHYVWGVAADDAGLRAQLDLLAEQLQTQETTT